MRRQLTILVMLSTWFVTATVAKGQTKLPPETRNAALRYWLAFADLQDPQSDKATQDLLEKTAAGEYSWDEAKLGPILDQNEQAIQEMQRATKLSECDWGQEYSRGPRASIAYAPRARVLARLNTLYGMRLMAKGQTQGAVETWLDGVKFSQHLAKGGTLIFKLVARTSLLSNLQALTGAARAGQLDDMQKHEIAAAVRMLPEDGFDWIEAVTLEEAALEIGVRQMQEAPNPAGYYQEMMNQPEPPNFSVPGPQDIAAFRSLFTQAETALGLPPERARNSLLEIQGRVKQLHPFFQQTTPSLVKINDERADVERARAKLLLAVAGS